MIHKINTEKELHAEQDPVDIREWDTAIRAALDGDIGVEASPMVPAAPADTPAPNKEKPRTSTRKRRQRGHHLHIPSPKRQRT